MTPGGIDTRGEFPGAATVSEELEDGVTASELVVLDPASLEPLETVGFAAELERGSLGGTALSGLAVAGDALYLTVDGEPFLVRCGSRERETKP